MKVKLHMKSGKTLSVPFIKDFSFEYNASNITKIKAEFTWFGMFVRKHRLCSRTDFRSVALSEIEAISYHPF